jgi:hypothetical protein
VDLLDENGYKVACAWNGQADVDAWIEHHLGGSVPNKTPTLARALSRTEAERFCETHFAYIKRAFTAHPPTGSLLCVCVTFGGALSATMPVETAA